MKFIKEVLESGVFGCIVIFFVITISGAVVSLYTLVTEIITELFPLIDKEYLWGFLLLWFFTSLGVYYFIFLKDGKEKKDE